MTVAKLKELLDCYDDGAHVVVAVLPPKAPLIVQAEGTRLEIHDGWCDGFGALNLIANHLAGDLDPDLKTENELE